MFTFSPRDMAFGIILLPIRDVKLINLSSVLNLINFDYGNRDIFVITGIASYKKCVLSSKSGPSQAPDCSVILQIWLFSLKIDKTLLGF